MLLSIIGSPCSGKTTTAAMVFAQLKEHGILAEFIPEQARTYIARKRIQQGLTSEDPVLLTDDDQLKIMNLQIDLEKVMKQACNPETVIVCDSSSLNALFYMSDELLQSEQIKSMIEEAKILYDGIFYCPPLKSFVAGDSNRVHGMDFSHEFHSRVPEMFKTHLEGLAFSAVLSGEPQARCFGMFTNVMDRILES